MKKISIIIFIVFFSCNSISFQNFSNDRRWKDKKFDSIVDLTFVYKPIIINEVKSEEPEFYDNSNSHRLDSVYKINQILIEKLNKRNIRIGEKGTMTLSIDTLLFQEYTEPLSVYTEYNNNEFIGNSERDFFKFKISGQIINGKNESERISAGRYHETYPRESYFISGVIVKDGIAASTERIIENSINEFSYYAYENLKFFMEIDQKE